MSLEFRVLGQPGRDNSLYVRLDTGHDILRLLFDCGEGCPQQLSLTDVQAIDLVAFSHFHIDHVAGFDSFLRHNFSRTDGPVRILGPADTADLIQRRLCGFTWNFTEETPGEFLVTEIHPTELRTRRYLTTEAFATSHDAGRRTFHRVAYQHEWFRIEAILLDHGITSVGYCVREATRHNVDPAMLEQRGLTPGPWLQQIKDPQVDPRQVVDLDGHRYRVQELRDELLVEVAGDSIAYLTDFRLDDTGREEVVDFLQGCRILVCENNYANSDADLAARNYHMVSREVARLAVAVQPEQLILIHLSDRYTPAGWLRQLDEVQRVFSKTSFPDHWRFEDAAE